MSHSSYWWWGIGQCNINGGGTHSSRWQRFESREAHPITAENKGGGIKVCPARSFENAADKTKGSGLQVQERPSSSCPSPLSKAFVQSLPHLSYLLQSGGEKGKYRKAEVSNLYMSFLSFWYNFFAASRCVFFSPPFDLRCHAGN